MNLCETWVEWVVSTRTDRSAFTRALEFSSFRRHTETERQRDRETERQRDRETDFCPKLAENCMN